MDEFRYQPEQRRCVDETGAALLVMTCPPWIEPIEGQPWIVLGVTKGHCLHVSQDDVPLLLWEIASRTADPYGMINKLVELSVQRAQ